MGLAQKKQTERSWEPALTEPGFSASMEQQLLLLQPAAANDLKAVAGHLRQRRMVLVNLEKVTQAQSRRMMDYLGGVVYGLDGQFYKVARRLYLLLPGQVEFKEEDFVRISP